MARVTIASLSAELAALNAKSQTYRETSQQVIQELQEKLALTAGEKDVLEVRTERLMHELAIIKEELYALERSIPEDPTHDTIDEHGMPVVIPAATQELLRRLKTEYSGAWEHIQVQQKGDNFQISFQNEFYKKNTSGCQSFFSALLEHLKVNSTALRCHSGLGRYGIWIKIRPLDYVPQ